MTPLERRQELRDELRRSRIYEDEQRAAAQRLGREHRASDKDDDAALTNLVRKGTKEAEKELEETRARRDSIAQQLATATEQAEAAGRARKASNATSKNSTSASSRRSAGKQRPSRRKPTRNSARCAARTPKRSARGRRPPARGRRYEAASSRR